MQGIRRAPSRGALPFVSLEEAEHPGLGRREVEASREVRALADVVRAEGNQGPGNVALEHGTLPNRRSTLLRCAACPRCPTA